MRLPTRDTTSEAPVEPFVVRVEDSESSSAADHAFTRSPIRIGRSRRNDLALTHLFVSAWHARIDFGERAARYTDLGSTNGSEVNGEPVEAHETVSLQADAEVRIGSLVLTFPGLERRGRAAPTPGGIAKVAAAVAEPRIAPGGITAMMKELAHASQEDVDAWRGVLYAGSVVDRFELLREIGRGSFGVVFEAKDRRLGRLVAFKAVRPGGHSLMIYRQESLQKEAEAVAQLNHPNIVSLYDAGTCESGPYLIFELLRGTTLHARLRQGRMPLPEALGVAIEIAWALEHAHAAGVIHRDLKPANVFLCSSGTVKVLDFGIANVLGGTGVAAPGTPAYMAPEQWRRAPQDPRADVFAAAAMLCESVTGRLPYRVTPEWSSVLEGAVPDVDPTLATPDLQALLVRALAPDPEARPRDGKAWLAELLTVHERLATPAAPEPPRR
jgi:eukaryotic-like serine/threonine-protein kinase